MRGRPAGQTVRRTVFGGRAFSPPPYGRLRRPALRAVSLRLAGGGGGQGPVFCGLCWRAAGRKPRLKNRKPAITHENPGEGSDCAGRRPGGSAAETGCARLPAACGGGRPAAAILCPHPTPCINRGSAPAGQTVLRTVSAASGRRPRLRRGALRSPLPLHQLSLRPPLPLHQFSPITPPCTYSPPPPKEVPR